MIMRAYGESMLAIEMGKPWLQKANERTIVEEDGRALVETNQRAQIVDKGRVHLLKPSDHLVWLDAARTINVDFAKRFIQLLALFRRDEEAITERRELGRGLEAFLPLLLGLWDKSNQEPRAIRGRSELGGRTAPLRGQLKRTRAELGSKFEPQQPRAPRRSGAAANFWSSGSP